MNRAACLATVLALVCGSPWALSIHADEPPQQETAKVYPAAPQGALNKDDVVEGRAVVGNTVNVAEEAQQDANAEAAPPQDVAAPLLVIEAEPPDGEPAPAPEPPAAGLGVVGRIVFGAVLPIRAPQPAVIDKATLAAQAQQFAIQFRPLLVSELNFVRAVCGEDLTLEQRKEIKTAGEESLEQAARRFAKFQLQHNGMLARQPDPRKIVSRGVIAALAEVVSNEKLARYVDESAKRQENRRRTAILSGVACLDGFLRLSAEQRDKIIESISTQWKGDVDSWLMLHNYNGQYVPQIPDPFVVPHLTAEQKVVWNGLQKVSFGQSWNEDGMMIPTDEQWWGGAIAPELPGANPDVIDGELQVIEGAP